MIKYNNNILPIIFGFMLVILLPTLFFAQASQSGQVSVESDTVVKGGKIDSQKYLQDVQ